MQGLSLSRRAEDKPDPLESTLERNNEEGGTCWCNLSIVHLYSGEMTGATEAGDQD